MMARPVSYIRRIIATAIIFMGLAFVVNVAVDPLWYAEGNQVSGINYPFNERLSKVNLYLKAPELYDCILFGSSRTTLLDSTKITSHRCFNFSFADGIPAEFVEYARYISDLGQSPELVIAGIDGREFSRDERVSRSPTFVLNLDRPPNVLKTYLSFDALVLSIRTLVQDSPQPRYYTATFVGDVLQNVPSFAPPVCFSIEGFGRPFISKKIKYYRELRSYFPNAIFVGYVTPISAWDVLSLYQDGSLSSYLETIYSLSELFDEFYDFSIPSVITARVDNTYDGHHYSRATNDEIAAVINGGESDFGITLHNGSFFAYRSRFEHATLEFSSAWPAKIPFERICGRRSTAR